MASVRNCFEYGRTQRHGALLVSTLLGLAAAIVLCVPAIARGGDVEYSVGGITATISDDVTGLAAAIADINPAVDADAGLNNLAEVDITVKGAQTATGNVDNSAMWDLNATKGYKSVAITGSGAGQELKGPAGTDFRALMRITNVSDEVSIQGMTYSGGKKIGVDNTSVAGGGLRVNDIAATDAAIDLTNVVFSGNAVTNNFGGGAFSAGMEYFGDASMAAGKGDLTFDKVDMTANKALSTNSEGGNVAGGFSAQGGGARLVYFNTLDYANSSIVNNEVEVSHGSHAHGGGLYLGANSVAAPAGGFQIALKDMTFDRNKAAVNEKGANPQSFARGGALMVYGYADAALTTVLVDTGVKFTGNQTIAKSAAQEEVVAMGGAVHLRHNVDALFDGTEFDGNSATAAKGYAWGGAVSTDYDAAHPANEEYDNTKLEFTGAKFNKSAATGGVEALGGAIYLHKGDLAVNQGTTFTKSTASSGVLARGGAIYLRDPGMLSVEGSTFGGGSADANLAKGDTAQGGSIYSAGGNNNNITDSRFSYSKAEGTAIGQGGAFYLEAGKSNLLGNTFENGLASGKTAEGGAVYANAGTEVTIKNNGDASVFTANQAQAKVTGGAAAGGAVYLSGAKAEIEDATFSKNIADATADAQGGAVANTAGALNVSRTVFIENEAKGAKASGGGLNIAGGVAAGSLGNNAFTGNKALGATSSYGGAVNTGSGFIQTGGSFTDNLAGASATAATGKAFGGAIASKGDVKLTDVGDISGNKAVGATGLGGAIFMNTNMAGGVATTTLDLSAAGGDVTVKGNTASGKKVDGKTLFKDAAIFFGADTGDSTAGAEFNVSAEAKRSLSILDGTGAHLNGGKNYTFNRNGAGTVTLGGENTYHLTGGTTRLNFNEGNTILASDYSATFLGDSKATVNLADNSTLTLALSRKEPATPLFDFQNTGTSKFSVGRQVKLDAAIDGMAYGSRPVESFDARYVLASGLTKTTAQNALGSLELGDGLKYVQVDGLKSVKNADGSYSIVSDAKFTSPFETSSANARRAVGALDQLINAADSPVSDNEYTAMLNNPRALTADLYNAQGYVMVEATGTVANLALDQALRAPHHAGIRLGSAGGVSGNGFASVPATRVAGRSAYGNGNGGGRQARAPRETYVSDYAYGFRVWGGYVGDYARHKGKSGYNGFRTERNGFLLGLNYDFGAAGSIGAYAGYSYAETNDRDVEASIKQDTGHFGLLGRVSPIASLPNFSLYGDAGYHFSRNKSNREYGWNNAIYKASGKFDQGVFTAGAAVDYLICLGAFNLTPYAKLRYSYLDQDGLNESGSAGSTVYDRGFHKNALTHRLGFEASYDFRVGSGIITPVVDVAWKHQWASRRYSSSGYYNKISAPVAFRTSTRRMPRDSIDLGLAARASFDIGGGKQAGGEGGVTVNLADKSRTASIYVGGFLSF